MKIRFNTLAPQNIFKFRAKQLSELQDYFGIGNQNANIKTKPLKKLKQKYQSEFDFADLSVLNLEDFKDLKTALILKQFNQFVKSKIATMTLSNDCYKSVQNPSMLPFHTLGVVINKTEGQTPKEILIIDSLSENFFFAKSIQETIYAGFKKLFPEAKILFKAAAQQVDGSRSCMNWTLKNLEIAKKYLGKPAEFIFSKLPKSKDLRKILKEQKTCTT